MNTLEGVLAVIHTEVNPDREIYSVTEAAAYCTDSGFLERWNIKSAGVIQAGPMAAAVLKRTLRSNGIKLSIQIDEHFAID